MSNSWLPTWLGAAWTVVFVVVLLVHLGHLFQMTGRARGWHATHVLMAFGMIDMVWPQHSVLVGRVGGVAVFTVAAVAVAVFAVVDGVRHGRWNRLWAISALDLALMAYMFQLTASTVQVLTLLATAWFVVEAVAWATGQLLPRTAHTGRVAEVAVADDGVGTVESGSRVGPADGSAELDPAYSDSAASEPAGRATSATGGTAEPALTGSSGIATLTRPVRASEPGTAPSHGRHGRLHQLSLRITLPAMSLGMAYMFLAMQYGGADGMRGTSGM